MESCSPCLLFPYLLPKETALEAYAQELPYLVSMALVSEDAGCPVWQEVVNLGVSGLILTLFVSHLSVPVKHFSLS